MSRSKKKPEVRCCRYCSRDTRLKSMICSRCLFGDPSDGDPGGPVWEFSRDEEIKQEVNDAIDNMLN